jgi:hypothetical protein
MYTSNRTTKLCKFLSKQRKQATSKLVFLSQSPQAGRLLLAQEGPLWQFAKILKAQDGPPSWQGMEKTNYKYMVYAQVEPYKAN